MLLCLSVPAAAFPDMYIWTDARGVKHFSDSAPVETNQYRTERMVERSSPGTRPDNGSGRVAAPSRPSSTPPPSEKSNPSSRRRMAKRLVQKNILLRELQGKMEVYQENVNEKKRELDRRRLRLEKIKKESYRNYAAHERRIDQWIKRVERAHQRLFRAEDKMDGLYDKISTLEAEIGRLE
jgi:hypothetical protein